MNALLNSVILISAIDTCVASFIALTTIVMTMAGVATFITCHTTYVKFDWIISESKNSMTYMNKSPDSITSFLVRKMRSHSDDLFIYRSERKGFKNDGEDSKFS